VWGGRSCLVSSGRRSVYRRDEKNGCRSSAKMRYSGTIDIFGMLVSTISDAQSTH